LPKRSCCARPTRNAEAFKILNQGSNPQPISRISFTDHALTAEKLERFDILEADLTKLIRYRPDNAHGLQRAWLLVRGPQHPPEEARKLIEKGDHPRT